MYIYIHIYMYVCIYIYIYTYIFTCMCTYMPTCADLRQLNQTYAHVIDSPALKYILRVVLAGCLAYTMGWLRLVGSFKF